MRIYLSGPMSGLPDLNFPAFHAEAARLRALGYDVVSPAEVNPDHTMSWEQCMRADIKALCDCDAIALMPGWENSKGAHLELHIAHRIGLKVCHTSALQAYRLPFAGVRVDGDCVIVKTRSNEAARELCGLMLAPVVLTTLKLGMHDVSLAPSTITWQAHDSNSPVDSDGGHPD